jgi:hypothetical protein
MGSISLCQTHKSYFILHAQVFQDLCAFKNLLVVCQSKLFHSNVGVVWDVGIECFCIFHVGSREDVYVDGSPLVNNIENNLKWLVVFMRVTSKQFDPKRLIIFY